MKSIIEFWKKWFGEGTEDDWRNFGWRITEYFAIKPEWAWTILDIRFIYRTKDGYWKLIDWRLPYKTEQNFWNALFSLQIYVVKYKWLMIPKLHIVFRPCNKYYLLIATPGLLFDRGEFHAKFAIMNWQIERDVYGCNEPRLWDEGSL